MRRIVETELRIFKLVYYRGRCNIWGSAWFECPMIPTNRTQGLRGFCVYFPADVGMISLNTSHTPLRLSTQSW